MWVVRSDEGGDGRMKMGMNPDITSLVDSRSPDSFIDFAFISTNHLLATQIPPIQLHLMDGTSNSVITQALDLPICFPTGDTQTLSFFVTLLDQVKVGLYST